MKPQKLCLVDGQGARHIGRIRSPLLRFSGHERRAVVILPRKTEGELTVVNAGAGQLEIRHARYSGALVLPPLTVSSIDTVRQPIWAVIFAQHNLIQRMEHRAA